MFSGESSLHTRGHFTTARVENGYRLSVAFRANLGRLPSAVPPKRSLRVIPSC